MNAGQSPYRGRKPGSACTGRPGMLRNHGDCLFLRPIIDIAVHPLQVTVQTDAEHPVAVTEGRYPFVASFRVHRRVSPDKHPRPLVPVAVQFIHVRGTPSQTEVGGEPPVSGKLIVASQAVGHVVKLSCPAIGASRPVITHWHGFPAYPGGGLLQRLPWPGDISRFRISLPVSPCSSG